MVSVRAGTADDVERVNEYYASRRRGREAKSEDFLLLAEDNHTVIGVVRLCPEEGFLVLRGMDIAPTYRRQGLGKKMLLQLVAHIGEYDCYSLPWEHLQPFYGIIGFERVADTDLPGFLQDRMAKTHEQMQDAEIQRLMQADLGVYPESGLAMIGMMRPKNTIINP